MNGTAPPPLIVPLSPTARDRARAFAAEQATPEKGMGVYLNTLAVWAVHRYLQWLQIETDLTQGDSWNPRLRAIFDVADLVVPHWGKLECRPVLEGEDAIALPPEATQNRRGYIAVRINNTLQEVHLLGFYPAEIALLQDCIPLDRLQSLEVLLDSIPEPETLPVDLGQWLQNIFSPGWQAIEALIAPAPTTFAFRRHLIRQAKQIELEYPIILLVTIKPENGDNLIVNLQIFPKDATACLPDRTSLTILTETGEVFREITSKAGDRLLQYELSGERGEQFQINITSGNCTITETFAI